MSSSVLKYVLPWCRLSYKRATSSATDNKCEDSALPMHTCHLTLERPFQLGLSIRGITAVASFSLFAVLLKVDHQLN